MHAKETCKEDNKAGALVIMWFLSAVEWVPVRLAEVGDVQLRRVWMEMVDGMTAKHNQFSRALSFCKVVNFFLFFLFFFGCVLSSL